MKAGKLLLGLVSGAAAGAVLGLLYAPKKGTETRKTIADTSNSYIKDANRGINDFTDSLNHKMAALKSKTKAGFASNKSEEKINQAKAEMHEMQA